jgi:hypothetical protein
MSIIGYKPHDGKWYGYNTETKQWEKVVRFVTEPVPDDSCPEQVKNELAAMMADIIELGGKNNG